MPGCYCGKGYIRSITFTFCSVTSPAKNTHHWSPPAGHTANLPPSAGIESTFIVSNSNRSNWKRALPKLFPPQPCRIRLARSLASSGKLGLSNRFGYVHRATTCSAKKMPIGHFSMLILSSWCYVNFPWKWRSRMLANLKNRLSVKSLQLVCFFLRVVLTEEKKPYQVPS